MKRIAIIVTVLALVAIVLFLVVGNLNASNVFSRNKTVPTENVSSISVETQQPNPASSKDVSAQCKLIPSRFVNLSFNTPGLVAEVLVSEGQTVEEGAVLAHLSNREQAQAAVVTGQLDVLNAQQALKKVYDEAPVKAAEALQALVEGPENVSETERILAGLKSGVINQTDIDIAKANLSLAEKKLKSAQDAYRPYANKEDSLIKATLLNKLSEAENEYKAALRKYNGMIGPADQTQISQAEADLALAKVRLAEAQRRYEILKNGPDPDEVAIAQARLANAEAQLAAARDSLQSLELRAPFSGTITSLNLKPGEYVSPGVPILLLVDFSNWLVETTDLNELNVVRINVGYPAIIKFDALPDLQFQGNVQRINAVGENRQGDITYTLWTDIDKLDDRLRWNMTCSVAIRSN
jgi:HlyD family secretion protein